MSDIPDNWNFIIIHPDVEKLAEEIEKLRTELSILVLERDSLIYQECKNIEAVYMMSVGVLEYKIYEIECAVLRTKRKIELIQARINRQEKIVPALIEAQLDAEFADYMEKLNEQLHRMNNALLRNMGKLLSEEDARELKKLYRMVVKALHPDMHPNQSAQKLKLFHNAVDAYERADLDALRVINTLVTQPTFPDTGGDNSIVFLTNERQRLEELLQGVKDRIAEIKTEYPYTMKALIQNPEKTEAKKAELNERIKQLNEALSAYTARINEMMR